MTTDVELEVQKARVLPLFERWKERLGLASWRIGIEWSREHRDDDGGPSMDVRVQWEYRSADVTAFVPTVSSISDDRLEWGIVHELMHVLVAEMGKPGRSKAEERVCSQLASAFIWTWNTAVEETKEAAPGSSANGYKEFGDARTWGVPFSAVPATTGSG